jgi:uncharacterized membrane protein
MNERGKGEGEKGRKGEEFSPENPLSEFSDSEKSEGIISPSPFLHISLSPFLLLHLAITLPLAYLLNIWTDEASTLYTTEHGFLHAFENVFANEKQAPLYFLLMSLWRLLDDSIFFARLFSIICSLLAIIVFYRLARKFWKDKTAIFVSGIFALHPYLIMASLEIRLYSLLILISALLLKLFFEGYLYSEEISHAKARRAQSELKFKNPRILFIVLSIVGLYVNYYVGFLLVGCFLALLILRRWSATKTYFLQMIPVGLAILPLLWIIQRQFLERAAAFNAEKPLIEGVKTLWNHFLTFVLPTEVFPVMGELTAFSFARLWIVRIAILAIVVLLIKTKGKFLDEKVIALAAIYAVCSLFLLGVYLLLGIKYIEIRHSAIAFVPLILLVALLLSKLLPKKSWIFVAALYAVFFSYSIYALYPNLAKRGDWARVAEYIEKNEKPNQPIIVFRNYDALSLPYHYRGINVILPKDNFFDWEAEDAPDSPNVFRKQTEFIISKIPVDAEEIWLLTDETCQVSETQVRCQPLENFVRANYTVEETKDFYLERVRLLRKKRND